jgi:hypothetical protein
VNTTVIRNTKVKTLPYLPPLIGSKTTRSITKHFTNLPLYLDGDHLSLLNWLVYQSRQDNTVHYTTHLLSKYRESILAAKEQYGVDLGLVISIQLIRGLFKDLIEDGYLLDNYQADIFTINPMLTYRHEYIRKEEYSNLVKMYQSIQFGTGGDPREIGKILSETINKRIKDKKL